MRDNRWTRAARRATHPLYRRLESTVHPLRYLFLEITRRCNLKCLHCGSDCGREARGRRDLEAEDWLAFVEYLASHFTPRKLFVVITGGEPLCEPSVFDVLEALALHRFPAGLVTNGFALDEPTVDRLVGGGLHSVTVSLDGLRASHDWLRGVAGSHERALGGIARLARAPIPLFDVVTCAHPRNLRELPEVLSLLADAGVRRWRIFSVFPKGRARGRADLSLTDDQVRSLMEWIGEARMELEGTGFTLDFSCEGYLPPAIDASVRDEPYFCRAGICIGSVLVDGSISACPNIAGSLVQGNIRDDDFAEVWERRFLEFRNRSWMRRGPCVACDQWGRCQGNSLHLWDEEAGRTGRCYHRILEGG